MTKNENQRILEAFDKFKATMDESYHLVRDSLEDGRYEDAQRILARIGVTHAKTSMSMRNYLIKQGLIKGDE
jgi:hypothetical protein